MTCVVFLFVHVVDNELLHFVGISQSFVVKRANDVDLVIPVHCAGHVDDVVGVVDAEAAKMESVIREKACLVS